MSTFRLAKRHCYYNTLFPEDIVKKSKICYNTVTIVTVHTYGVHSNLLFATFCDICFWKTIFKMR